MEKPTLTLVSHERGVKDYDVADMPKVHRICVGDSIKKGDICNVYCDDCVKLGAAWQGDVQKTLAHFAKNNSRYQELVQDNKPTGASMRM